MTGIDWGSDAVAALVRSLSFKHVALVPGSSFRGLHDSLVNYLDDGDLEMLVCLHEEHAVAIAHGYAKVTNTPMLAIVHANVGLMHASMAFFDAWADRVPMVVLGATGPVDAAKRRPWIDWLHTSRDQAAIVRPYTKWDDQPGSVEATMESITRAYQIACTPPYGPTYVVLDVAMQEERIERAIPMPKLERFAPPKLPVPAPEDVRTAVAIMRAAKRPVIFIGRATRDLTAWNERIALAEALDARVITDVKAGAGFPTAHRLHVGLTSSRLTAEGVAALKEADAILSLESVDLAGSLKQVFGTTPTPAKVVACSVDRYLHNGWSMDHQALPGVDLDIVVEQSSLVHAMLAELGAAPAPVHANGTANARPSVTTEPLPEGQMGIASFSEGLNDAFASSEVCYIRLPLGTNGGAAFSFTHPLDFLGGDGGGGVGAGPGLAVGAALALRGTSRLPVAVLGDGDYLMGLTAIWTAAANKIPLLVIVANNRCYYNDIVHQERIARQRDRPVERKWIGQTISDPAPDLAMLARGQGAIGIGPVTDRAGMREALAQAVEQVRGGAVCVVDILVAPEYDKRGEAAITGYAGSAR